MGRSLCLYSKYRTFLMLVFKIQAQGTFCILNTSIRNVLYFEYKHKERSACIQNTERSLCLYSNTECSLCLYSKYRTFLMLVFKIQNVPYACIQNTERSLCLYSKYRTFLMFVFKIQNVPYACIQNTERSLCLYFEYKHKERSVF